MTGLDETAMVVAGRREEHSGPSSAAPGSNDTPADRGRSCGSSAGWVTGVGERLMGQQVDDGGVSVGCARGDGGCAGQGSLPAAARAPGPREQSVARIGRVEIAECQAI